MLISGRLANSINHFVSLCTYKAGGLKKIFALKVSNLTMRVTFGNILKMPIDKDSDNDSYSNKYYCNYRYNQYLNTIIHTFFMD